ncbi:hypothetical protein KC906_02525 [Candidatus Kaiserbacteria bacterium]|nr:hypothetical protein [Candidatus Kaiserbacteria bacterium]MCB9812691.1 hypothetical protein [Candidatus Nomurabacteria bacterium]
MTAFNDVMTAEAAAVQMITSAKEEVAVAIATARSAAKTRIEEENAALAAAAEAARDAHQSKLNGTIGQFKTDTEAQVAAVKQRFASKRAEFEKLILTRFQ